MLSRIVHVDTRYLGNYRHRCPSFGRLLRYGLKDSLRINCACTDREPRVFRNRYRKERNEEQVSRSIQRPVHFDSPHPLSPAQCDFYRSLSAISLWYPLVCVFKEQCQGGFNQDLFEKDTARTLVAYAIWTCSSLLETEGKEDEIIS